MSRVKKTIKNAKVNVFFYAITIFISFFSRKIFLDHLGADFIGLVGTLRSMVGFINIAELGVGTAIGYALYKPLFNRDFNEINKIISLLGFLYKKIGLFILLAGILLSLFFPLIFSNTSFSFGIIFFLFFTFLSSSLLSYFFTYHQNVLNYDQKGYIVSQYLQSANILRILVQILLVTFFNNYYLWIAIELIFPFIYALIIRYKIKKEYPELIINLKTNTNTLKEYASIIKKVKQIFVQNIASFILNGTDNILIYTFASLKAVAFIGNYQLIILSATGLIGTLVSGTSAAIGNVIAENNSQTIKKTFWEMMTLQYFIASFLFINIFFLVNNFIALWLGEQYILGNDLVILMLIMATIAQIRIPVMNYLNAYGLFHDVWSSIAEAIINLLISLVFGYLYGIKGIFWGTIISTGLIILIWKPYFLYTHGFKKSVYEYWIGNIKLTVPFLIVFGLIFFYLESTAITVDNFYNWVYIALKLSSFSFISLTLLFYIFNKGARDLIYRVFVFIKKQ